MDQLFQKSISGPKQKKEYHRIMHIQTSVGSNFSELLNSRLNEKR